MRGTWFLSFKLCSPLFGGCRAAGPLAEDELVLRGSSGKTLDEGGARVHGHRAATRGLDRHRAGTGGATPDDHPAARLLHEDRQPVRVERRFRLSVLERQPALE